MTTVIGIGFSAMYLHTTLTRSRSVKEEGGEVA